MKYVITTTLLSCVEAGAAGADPCFSWLIESARTWDFQKQTLMWDAPIGLNKNICDW